MYALRKVGAIILSMMMVITMIPSTAVSYAAEVTEHMLTLDQASVENGQVKIDGTTSVGKNYRVGENAKLIINADKGYVLDQDAMVFSKGDDKVDPEDISGTYTEAKKIAGNVWSDDEYTFEMPDYDMTFKPAFKKVDYSLTLKGTAGHGTASLESETANYGDTVKVTVDPEEHYSCTGVTYTIKANKNYENDVVENAEKVYGKNEFTFEMPCADVEVKASFSYTTHSIIVKNDDPHKSEITPDKWEHAYNDNVTIKTKQSSTYVIVPVVTDGNNENVSVTKVNNETYTFTMPDSDVTISSKEEGAITYVDEKGQIKTLSEGEYQEVNKTNFPDGIGQGFGTGWYVVKESQTYEHRLTITGTTNLIICNGAELKLEYGLRMATRGYSPKLHIWAQGKTEGEETGKLTCSAESYNAGIGGNEDEDNGVVYVHGGIVTANGGKYGAGIGGGETGRGGSVYVYAGTVKATGGDYAAGIGGGQYASGSFLYVSGNAEVTATGGDKGAGVGGGEDHSGGNVTVDGGTLTANGGEYAAGIGGGEGGGQGGTVIINGGTVTAKGEDEAAGIGGGQYSGGGGEGGAVQINGGTVHAIANNNENDGDGAEAIGHGGNKEGLSSGTISVYGKAKVEYKSQPSHAFTTLEVLSTHEQFDGNKYYDTRNTTRKESFARSMVVDIYECTEHEPVYYQGDDPAKHEHACKYCGETLEVEEHKYADNGVCEICGKENGPVQYIDENGKKATLAYGDYTVYTDFSSRFLEAKWYVVRGTVRSSERLTVTGDTKFVLTNGSKLHLDDGIRMASDGYDPKLTIYGQTGTEEEVGYMYAGAGADEDADGDYKAGIGGNDGEFNGEINICGGRVAADGGDCAAGLGGGRGGGTGTVNIYGGFVTATGGKKAAGIGNGENGYRGGHVNIYGGKVTATGGDYGAGIGGGINRDGGMIKIDGGEVYAYGGTDAAGIGGGEDGAGGNITINGGEVTAKGKSYGAGIGGGEDQTGGTIVINGGIVKATRGGDGTPHAIGRGYDAGDNAGTLRLYKEAMVLAGESETSVVKAPKAERDGYCRWRAYAEIRPCDHEGEPYDHDENGHWNVCKYCESNQGGYAAHEYEWQFDEEGHWQHCTVCGYDAPKENHAIADQEKELCKCSVQMVKVTLKKDRDDESPVVEEYVKDHEYEYPGNPFKDVDKSFVGWYSKYAEDPDEDESLSFTGDTIEVEKDLVLTAKWGMSWKGIQDQIRATVSDGGSSLEIKLTDDIYADVNDVVTVPEDFTLTLDLNGYTINRRVLEAYRYGYAFRVEGTLNLTSSSEEPGIITGCYGSNYADAGCIYVAQAGKLKASNLELVENKTEGNGGALVVEGGTAELEKVNIEGNYAQVYGGGVFVTNGGKLSLDGCGVNRNYAEKDGAGIYAHGTALLCSLKDTTVVGNYSYQGIGGGVFAPQGSASLEVSGKVTVTDNIDTTGTSNMRINGSLIKVPEALDEASVIGFSTTIAEGEDTAVVTNGLSGKGSEESFVSDDEKILTGINQDGEVIVGTKTVKVSFAKGVSPVAEEPITGKMDPVTVLKGSLYKLPACGFQAPSGYMFANWQIGDAVQTSAVTVDEDVTLTATYMEIPDDMFAVTVTNDGHGTAAAAPQAQKTNETVALTADAEEGYRFKEWTITEGADSGCKIDDATKAEAVLTMGNAKVTVNAAFEAIPVDMIELDTTEITLPVGGEETLTATVIPASALNKDVVWASSDESVVTVADGKIKAIAEGSATITVTSEDNEEVTAKCEVEVAHEHAMEHTEYKAPGCTTKGNKEYYYCTKCKKYFADKDGTEPLSEYNLSIPAAGHDWGDWTVTPSTVGKQGSQTRVCKRDSSHVQTISLPAVNTQRIDDAVTEAGKLMAETKVSTDGSDIEPIDLWVTQKDVDDLTAAIKAAEAVKADLDSDQGNLNEAGKLLEEAVQAFDNTRKAGTKPSEDEEKAKEDAEKAEAVTDILNALPEAKDVTLDSEESITLARAAYNALTEDQKALVPESAYRKLLKAEDALAELNGKWTVSFDANGGTGAMASEEVKKGEKYKLPENGFGEPDGKEFDGWDKGAAGEEIDITENTVVKAQWKDKAPAPVDPEEEAKKAATAEANKALDQAAALKADDYTEDSFKAVTDAKAALEKVLANADAKSDDIKAATKTLTEAIDALKTKADEEAEKEAEAKKAAAADATAALGKAAALKADDYTEDSFKAVTDAKAALEAVLDKADSTSAQIKAATKTLTDAIDALVAKETVKTKKANTMVAKAKAKTIKVKAAKLKKKAVKIKKKKAFKVTKAKGTVSFKLTKKAKKAKNKIKVTKKGVIKLAKGLKKGKYVIKVRVRAAGNADYKAMNKTVKITIRVK